MSKIIHLDHRESNPELIKKLEEEWLAEIADLEEETEYIMKYLHNTPEDNIFELRKRETIGTEFLKDLEKYINKPLKP